MPRRKRSVSETFSDIYDDDSSENGQPIQRNAANARERARMRVLSSAFCRLKTKLPWVPADTKLSKLDTLRLAKGYIQQLEAILAGQPIDDNLQIASGQHHNLSWPFIFQTCSPDGSPKMSSSSTSPGMQLANHHQNNNSHSHNNNNIHHQSQHPQQQYNAIQRSTGGVHLEGHTYTSSILMQHQGQFFHTAMS